MLNALNATLNFLGVHVHCEEFPFTNNTRGNSYQASRKIAVKGQPRTVTLAITTSAVEGFDLAPWAMRPSQDMKFSPEQDIYRLAVAVKWLEADTPHTRQRGVDNVDIIFRSRQGRFLDIQVALVTWRGEFFATVQQQYLGQVVRTMGPRPGTRALDVIAIDPVNNFPGNKGFEGTWERMGFLLKEMVGVDMEGEKLCRVNEAAWTDPTFKASQNRWESGVTLYYNLVTGQGRIMDPTGAQYFVDARRMVDVPKRALPVLEPGKLCWFRLAEPEPGQAQGVKSVKPDLE